MIVELKHHADGSHLEQDHEQLLIEWQPEGHTRSTFVGRFIIRPSDTGAEVVLKGEYSPPLELLDPALGIVFDDHAAHATSRMLLEDIASALCAEAELVREFQHGLETEGREPRFTTGWKTSSSGERYPRGEDDV